MTKPNLTLSSPRPSSGGNPNVPVLVKSNVSKDLPPNHILLRVDRFGFSANNTTYQALGEAPHFRYFEFHAPPTNSDVSRKSHGLIPVWGFATVVVSTHSSIPVGERVYGYLAPARYLLVPVSPTDVNKYAFYVPRPHLPADRRPYNQFIRCATDPQYNPTPIIEDYTMLYRPLFWTAFWCADWLARARFRGAKHLLVSSASAKTAFLLAYCVRMTQSGVDRPRLVGLTSTRNLEFTQGLGLYDVVTTYDSFESTEALKGKDGETWVYADVASDTALNERIFSHLGNAAVGAVTLGMSTLSTSGASTSAAVQAGANTALDAQVGPAAAAPAQSVAVRMEPFFMVEWLAVRRKELSVRQIVDMQARAWSGLMRDCPPWVRIERVRGGEAVMKAYEEVINGRVGPDRGFIWSLWDDEDGGRVVAKL